MSISESEQMAGVATERDLPGSFIDDVDRKLRGEIPNEKLQCELRQAQIARAMKTSERIEGLGQKAAEIDPRLYFRALHAWGHHEGWLQDLLADNPYLCAPGYKPKRRADFRHGITFCNGVPVGQGPRSHTFK